MRRYFSSSLKALIILSFFAFTACESGSKGTIRVNGDGGTANDPTTDGKPLPGKISTPLANLTLHLFQISFIQAELEEFFSRNESFCRSDMNPTLVDGETDQWVFKREWNCPINSNRRFGRDGVDSWTLKLKPGTDPNDFGLSDVETIKYKNIGTTTLKRAKAGTHRFYEVQITESEWSMSVDGDHVRIQNAADSIEFVNEKAKPATRFEIGLSLAADISLGDPANLWTGVQWTLRNARTELFHKRNDESRDITLFASKTKWKWAADAMILSTCRLPKGKGTADYLSQKGNETESKKTFDFTAAEESISETLTPQSLGETDCGESETQLLGLLFSGLEYLD